MRRCSFMECVTMVCTALLCIGVSVLSVITGGYDVSTVGALVTGSIVVGGVLGSPVVRRLPDDIRAIVLPISLVLLTECILFYEVFTPAAIIVACIASGVVAGSCCGALRRHRGMEV